MPWANTEKHSRFVNVSLKCSGLWSRYGQPIQAPDWWLDQMPKIVLDGELWGGRGLFQKTCSIVQTKSGNRDGDWATINYMAFDSPGINYWLPDRLIDIPNMSSG